MMKRNNSYLLPTILAVVLSIGVWLGYFLAPKSFGFSADTSGGHYQKLSDIINILDERYVDPIQADSLFEQTISDMLHKLDPHSNYIPARDLAMINETIEGKFGGIGVRFFILRDTICVTAVVQGSPSQRAGIKAGDKIIQVDGKSVASKKITNEKVMKLLKGKENTVVQVAVLREKQLIKKKLVRGSIPIESVSAAYLIGPGTGYLKIDEFSVTTADEFRQAVSWLKQKGMRKLVLDLRNNGGGVMQTAVEIADELLPNGMTIVETKGEHSGSKKYYATRGGMLENAQVVVMINSNSASASEILAGAIQDNDRGTIVGRRSFGKGLVQEDLPLRDGSNLRLTVARYYTPTGRCIQRSYDKGYDDYYQEKMAEFDNGELFKPDTNKVDSLRYRTPKGKIVYGGGGISPDVFIPFDSSGMSWYYTELRYSQAFNAFAFDFLQGKRSTWKSLDEFERKFIVSDALLQRFVQFSEKELKIKPDQGAIKRGKALIVQTMKAEIARQIWLEDGYYRIMNATDKEVQRALRSLR